MKQRIKNLLCRIGIHYNWSITACNTIHCMDCGKVLGEKED